MGSKVGVPGKEGQDKGTRTSSGGPLKLSFPLVTPSFPPSTPFFPTHSDPTPPSSPCPRQTPEAPSTLLSPSLCGGVVVRTVGPVDPFLPGPEVVRYAGTKNRGVGTKIFRLPGQGLTGSVTDAVSPTTRSVSSAGRSWGAEGVRTK